MQKRRRLIVDMSSLLWTCLLVGKDTEFGREVMFAPEGSDKDPKPFWVNSAQHGYENIVNHFVAVLEKLDLAPMDMILVVEGLHSKMMRQNILPQYKAKRDRPDDSYIEFQKLRDMVVNLFTSLGAIAVTQDGVEADDIIAYLAMHLEGEKIIDSNDGDICALISDQFATLTKDVWVYKQSKGELLKENPYGPFSCRHITTMKAIVGDSSDKIPGAKGFGDKMWLDMLCNYDEDDLDTILELITTKTLDKLADDANDFKPFKKVIEQADMVYKSLQCARMYPDMINTMHKPLQWTPGMVKHSSQIEDKRVKHWAGQVRLIHAATYKQAIEFLKQHIESTPFFSFDIETSSNDTADQWLENAKTRSDQAERVDVFGAELTSFALTFGRNCQYTFFFTVDHVETDTVRNITKEQAKAVLELLPKHKVKAIQNVAFELPVVMENLGELQEAA